MWSLECWRYFMFLLASPLSRLMGIDIAHARNFPVEFLIAIQIKTTNHNWGNCTKPRIFVLCRISSPLAGHSDLAEQPQHPPLKPRICLAERGRNPNFTPLNPHQLPKLHKRKYCKDLSWKILQHRKPANPPTLFHYSVVIQACP